MVTAAELANHGLGPDESAAMAARIGRVLAARGSVEAWRVISREVLRADHPFALHSFLYKAVYADWDWDQGPPPAWLPAAETVADANIADLMRAAGVETYAALHEWSVQNPESYWGEIVKRLGIRFEHPPSRIMSPASKAESPRWLPDARLNIAASAFGPGPDAPAVIHQSEGGSLETMTAGELEALAGRVANGLRERGLQPGDAVAAVLPMTAEAVAIYLGAIMAGGVVVSIAESFMPPEIATRLRLGRARWVFTQDVLRRGGRDLPLYTKVVEAGAGTTIVLPAGDRTTVPPRDGDLRWEEFLGRREPVDYVPRDPGDPINILFSSGTTGDPKAIPWTHTTAIKCAADAYAHHDVHSGDVLAWPTSLGWMMGPWLIFAARLNRATIAIYDGAPTGVDFGRFVQDAGVTMLGVVPSLVRAWRQAECMRGLDWSTIKVFSSTGECSNAEDMLYLMSLAGYRPVIEYCGGTEIGGGYLTATVTTPASPATFTTPALGLDIAILDPQGQPTEHGEVFIRPPSIGLSTALLNGDHHEVYFADAPTAADGMPLRRHGDAIERLGGGYFRAHGRVDDTMNLGGIKVSSAEIERVLNGVEGVRETAAIAVPPAGGGPEELTVYAVIEADARDGAEELLAAMRTAVRSELNPLFKIADVHIVDALPRTASNKIMRRILRCRRASD